MKNRNKEQCKLDPCPCSVGGNWCYTHDRYDEECQEEASLCQPQSTTQGCKHEYLQGDICQDCFERIDLKKENHSVGDIDVLKSPWEERFDKEFPNAAWADLTLSGLTTRYNATNDIKNFIRQLLSDQRKELRRNLLKYKCGKHKKLLALLDES